MVGWDKVVGHKEGWNKKEGIKVRGKKERNENEGAIKDFHNK